MLKIRLLGGVQITLDDKPLKGLSSKKAVALLLYYEESLAILQGLKADSIAAHPLSGLGRLARDAGLYSGALGYFQQAMRLLQLESNAPRVLNVLFEAATVLLPSEGHQTLAHTLLRLVKEHPKTDNETRLLAQAYQPAPAPTMSLSEVIDVVLALEL